VSQCIVQSFWFFYNTFVWSKPQTLVGYLAYSKNSQLCIMWSCFRRWLSVAMTATHCRHSPYRMDHVCHWHLFQWMFVAFVTVKPSQVLRHWYHRALAPALCATCTSRACSSGSRVPTRSLVNSANSTFRWLLWSSRFGRLVNVGVPLAILMLLLNLEMLQ